MSDHLNPDNPDFDLIWHVVVPYLQNHGAPERSLRPTLGKLAKHKGRAAVILAFDRLMQARPRPADPWTYFLKLANQETQHGRPLSPAEQAAAAAFERRRKPLQQP